jgi:hypothetical protein
MGAHALSKVTNNLTKSRIRKVKDIIDHEKMEWKEEVVNKIFMPHDAEEILKIRLPKADTKDFVSWKLEKSGHFLVRSAFKLALNEKMGIIASNSSSKDGERGFWKNIWKANVPPKVRVFAWKLATDSLAVQENQSRRIPNLLPTCNICGMGDETGYHAVMECMTSRALQMEMMKIWALPSDYTMRYTGKEWVLVLLDSLNEDMKTKVMFMWWRAWHHRNDNIFGKRDASFSHSANFLKNYYESMQLIRNGKEEVDMKGKKAIGNIMPVQEKKAQEEDVSIWEKPSEGWIKVNVDASFLPDRMSGSWGVVVRDMKVTSCHQLGA